MVEMIKKVNGEMFSDRQFRLKMLEMIEKNYEKIIKKIDLK